MTYVPRSVSRAQPKRYLTDIDMPFGQSMPPAQGMPFGNQEPTPAGPPMDDMPMEEPPMQSILNPQMPPMPMKAPGFPRVLNHGQPEDGMTPSDNIRKIIEMRKSGKW